MRRTSNSAQNQRGLRQRPISNDEHGGRFEITSIGLIFFSIHIAQWRWPWLH